MATMLVRIRAVRGRFQPSGVGRPNPSNVEPAVRPRHPRYNFSVSRPGLSRKTGYRSNKTKTAETIGMGALVKDWDFALEGIRSTLVWSSF